MGWGFPACSLCPGWGSSAPCRGRVSLGLCLTRPGAVDPRSLLLGKGQVGWRRGWVLPGTRGSGVQGRLGLCPHPCSSILSGRSLSGLQRVQLLLHTLTPPSALPLPLSYFSCPPSPHAACPGGRFPQAQQVQGRWLGAILCLACWPQFGCFPQDLRAARCAMAQQWLWSGSGLFRRLGLGRCLLLVPGRHWWLLVPRGGPWEPGSPGWGPSGRVRPDWWSSGLNTWGVSCSFPR